MPFSLNMLLAIALKLVVVTMSLFGGSSFYLRTGAFTVAAAVGGVVPMVGPAFFGAAYFRGVGGCERAVDDGGLAVPRVTRRSALVLLVGTFIRMAGGVSKAASALSAILPQTVSGLTQVSPLPN